MGLQTQMFFITNAMNFFVSRYQGDNKYVGQFSGSFVVPKLVLTRPIKVAPLNFRVKIVFSVILFYKNGSMNITDLFWGSLLSLIQPPASRQRLKLSPVALASASIVASLLPADQYFKRAFLPIVLE